MFCCKKRVDFRVLPRFSGGVTFLLMEGREYFSNITKTKLIFVTCLAKENRMAEHSFP